MKKYILFLIFALSWQYAMAGVISENQARKCAAEFFTVLEKPTKATASSPGEFKLIYSFPEIETRSSSSEPALFVFQREYGGYAVVAGDDVACPILGYSPNGYFPVADMPDNMRAMLQWYADVIAFAREHNWSSAPNKEAGFGLDPENTVQLHTAKWDQGHPFNDLVAEINGQKPPIGCVATAISIIMRFHQWPQRGIGVLPSYDYEKGGVKYHINGYPLGHEYDWSKMPEDYLNCSEEEAAQIARLLYDVAVMSRMSFALGGSGASEKESAFRLADYFDYDKQMVYLERNRSSSDSQWEQYIIDEINAGRPVLYSGGNRDGHAFVIDGYNGCYFSVNYGWSGHTTSRDGHDVYGEFKDFYTLRPIDGHEEDLLVYNQYQGMAIQIMPNRGGTTNPIMAIGVMDDPHIPFSFDYNKNFSMHYGLTNFSLIPFTQDFRYILFNRNGDIKENISSIFRVTVPDRSGTSGHVTCRITKQLDEGDQILLCLNDPSSGEWVPIRQSRLNRIVFTTRPLSDLIQISLAKEPRYPDNRFPEKIRDLVVESYRDCVWGLYGENNKSILGNDHWISGELSENDVSYRSIMSDPEDLQCEMEVFEIWLPSGNYTLSVRNPATGEKMEIKLEL